MKTRPPCSHSFVVSPEVILLTCLFITTSVVGQDAIPQEFLTVAEKSAFKATSRSAEVEAFLAACADRADHVHKTAIGNTVEDRPIVAAIVANPPVQAAQHLKEDPRLVVMLLGNIHSGECAGKEALLMLLRELTLDAQHPWLAHAVFVFIPNYNADGNDRVGKAHRPGQLGPVDGMGLRENAQGFDLNRDFIKLATPEGNSLVRAIDRWNPHLFIDTHTTNGSKHRYQLTYDIPHNPAAPSAVVGYMRKQMLPAITEQLEKDGISTFYYGNFNREHTQWLTYGNEGRYSTEYCGLRGRLSILSEAYSYVSYQTRVEASKAFVLACVNYVVDEREDIKQLLAKASETFPESVPLRSKTVAFAEQPVVLGYDESDPENLKPKDYTVEFHGKSEPILKVKRPFAYVIPFECSRVADRLIRHGIPLTQLTEEVTLEIESYTAKKLDHASRPFQGHSMVTAEVTKTQKTQTLAKGSYVVRTDHPLGTLAVYLLEPESEDGLVTWNFFDDRWNNSDVYPVVRVPSEVPLKTLVVEQVVPAERLTMDKIYGPKNRISFQSSRSRPRWIPDSSEYQINSNGRSLQVEAETGSRSRFSSPLADAMEKAFSKLSGIRPDDAKSIAGRYQNRRITDRRLLISFAKDLFIYDTESQSARRLTRTQETEELADLSPNQEWVAFVRNGDLHVVDTATGKERSLVASESDQILNGKLDWVYQEELYGRGNYKGFWWSPDSQFIAFLQLDESPVHRYHVTDHIPVRQGHEITPYPKSGDPLPKVRLGIVPAIGGTPRWADFFAYSSEDLLISKVDWDPKGSRVVAQLQNRAQTWLDLSAIDPRSGKMTRLFRETTKAWVSVFGSPRWLNDGSFLWFSERSGNKHLYHYAADGELRQAVTSGNWDVGRFYGVDSEEEFLYFSAYKENNIQSHGYRIRLDGTGIERLTSGQGNHSLSFSSDFKYFFDTSSTAHQPSSVSLYRTSGPRLRVISPYVDDRLQFLAINEPEFLQVPTEDGESLDAMLIRPPNFDPKKKYPVLIYAYSGPQAPTVRDSWRGSTYLWHQMLAQEGYCIWMCDNRSASMRGAKSSWPIHRDLGKHELADIETGISWLKKQGWVDGERIGIWGWSYGGYMTAYALTHSKSFRMGISGAPVTDWRNYDAIYTERYMGLPQTNPDGYKSSSVVAAAKDLHGDLLLIHGTQDDNVHVSNTLQFALELQKARIPFSMMVYPKNRHGISRPGQSRHSRELMTRFIREKL